MRLIFFGSSKFVIPILETLHKNHDLVLVVTTEKLLTDAVPVYCSKYNIKCLSVSNFGEKTLNFQLSTLNCSLAVLAYFGLIIPKKILDLFPQGIINVHPSLLPKYRGPTPVQTAILNGGKTTGVTLIKLDEQVDHGPILAQIEEKILPTDTAENLYERLFKIGGQLLSKTINKYIKNDIKLSPQNDPKASFTKPLTRQNGYFDINNPPTPEVLDRMIRAYYPWPGVWTRLSLRLNLVRGSTSQRKIIKFLPASPAGGPENKLQVEGKKPMTIKDFINGYPDAASVILPILQISNTTNH